MVASHHGPLVCQGAQFAAAGVDHGFDGKDHASFQFHASAGFAVVQHLRVLVEFLAHAVPTIFAYNGKTLFFSVLLNGMAHITQGGAGFDLINTQPHAFISGFSQAAGQDAGLTHVVHTAGVTKPAVLNDGDVHIQNVAIFQHFIAGNAVTDNVVDGGANGAWKGWVARGRVAHGGGFDPQLIDALHAQAIQFAGCDTCFDKGSQVIKDGCRRLASSTHFFEISGVCDENTHSNLNRSIEK